MTRTRDGGKTFDVLTKGLPQTHAYDVVYRHALVLDEGGERLAFGSTTGGLWVSEDQGDSWTCVTHTLPPIVGRRFAGLFAKGCHPTDCAVRLAIFFGSHSRSFETTSSV